MRPRRVDEIDIYGSLLRELSAVVCTPSLSKAPSITHIFTLHGRDQMVRDVFEIRYLGRDLSHRDIIT